VTGSPSPDHTIAARFERNLAAFAERFPDLHGHLRCLSAPLSRIVWDNDTATDLDLGSGHLYKQDARDFAAQQVENFASKPARLYYSVPRQSNFDSMVSRHVFDTIMQSMKRHGVDRLSEIPYVTSGYLVVLGVGLGHHLLPLVQRMPALNLVIIEPFEEFLLQSLYSIDWVELFEHCDSNGMGIHLECHRTPIDIIRAVSQVFESHDPTLLDGTVLFSHYNLWEMAEAKRQIVNEMPRRMVTMGYFEDERKMLVNTATNLQRFDFRLFEGKVRPRGSVPVFLLGAGPSFDEVADIVRQWRDHAIIITSGSALPAALRHGIIPDFHTEVENGPDQYDKTKFVLERFPEMFPEGRLTGIRLIAPTTINPRVPPLFDDVYFYFREAVCSTTSFGRHLVPLRGSAPTVANTSLVSAACLGFGDIYMFGFDCGWRDDGDHHAKETIYYATDTFKLEEMKANYTLPGNFGGEVQSELVFDWSRNIMQSCIPAYRLNRLFNCSDGARIEGATPKVAEALDFATPIDREAVLANIRDTLPFFTAGEFFKEVDLEPLRTEVNSYVAELLAILEQALAEAWNFPKVADHIWRLYVKFNADRRVAAIIFFSTMAELKLATLLLCRIPSDDSRALVTRDFVSDFIELHIDMRDKTLNILDEMEDWFAGRAVPEWTKGLPTTPGTSY